MSYYAILFLAAYLVLLVALYLLPAGIFYWYFNRNTARSGSQKISKGTATRKDIYRDIKWSLISLAIFSFFAVIFYEWVGQGYTRMYYDFFEHGWFYPVVSFFLSLLIFDTYHYWFHRFMHLPGIFRHFHRVHHLSIAPTPWSMFAFGPLEAIIQIGIYPVLLFLLPLHPIVFGAFVIYVILINVGGHTSVELTPAHWSKHFLFKYNNRVSHHDFHHSNSRYNFGTCFNIWDRIANTFRDVPNQS